MSNLMNHCGAEFIVRVLGGPALNVDLASTYYFLRRDFGVAWEGTNHKKYNIFLILSWPEVENFQISHRKRNFWREIYRNKHLEGFLSS